MKFFSRITILFLIFICYGFVSNTVYVRGNDNPQTNMLDKDVTTDKVDEAPETETEDNITEGDTPESPPSGAPEGSESSDTPEAPKDADEVEDEKQDEKQDEDYNKLLLLISSDIAAFLDGKNLDALWNNGAIFKFINMGTLSKTHKLILEATVLKSIIDSGELEDSDIVSAEISINGRIQSLRSMHGFTANYMKNIEKKSEELAKKSKNFGKANLSKFLLTKDKFVFENVPVLYFNNFMVGLDDIAKIIDAELIEMEFNDTFVLKSGSGIIEATKGLGEIYVNDRIYIMPTPVIYVEGVYYMPLEFVIDVLGIDYQYFASEDTMVIY